MGDSYHLGYWSCSYRVSPVARPPSLNELRTVIQEVKGHETGWPVWLSLDNSPEMTPHVVDGTLECWLRDTEDGDYWRADPNGRMFLIRKLQEDTREIPGTTPGGFLDLTLPVWRTGECLLHARRLAMKLDAQHVELSMTWTGLKGRELRSLASRERLMFPGSISHQDKVTTTVTTDPSAINDTLPDLVEELVAPLFTCFSLFEAPHELWVTETTKMRRGI